MKRIAFPFYKKYPKIFILCLILIIILFSFINSSRSLEHLSPNQKARNSS